MEEETEPLKFDRLVQCMVRHTALLSSSKVDDNPFPEELAADVEMKLQAFPLTWPNNNLKNVFMYKVVLMRNRCGCRDPVALMRQGEDYMPPPPQFRAAD